MTIGRIPSVEGGIQPTIVDAKGDLIAATAADTVNRLAVGSNDQVLVADSTQSTGLAWKSVATPFAAGKNKIINGDMNIWQRGTSVTAGATGYFYGADRWLGYSQSGTSSTISRQSFTAGTAPVAGYEGTFFLRTVDTVGQATLEQRIEDVRIFAGQTVTLSYWAKSNSNQNITNNLIQNFGSGGSSAVYATVVSGLTSAVTTSWQRFTVVFTVPSISGKTIGTSSYLQLNLLGSGTNNALDYWGVQLEVGAVATPFQTATGTLQGELAACQRYYYRTVAGGAYTVLGLAATTSTTAGTGHLQLPVSMRGTPTSIDYSALGFILPSNNTTYAISSASLNTTLTNGNMLAVDFVVATTTSSVLGRLAINNSATGYLGCSAEL